MPHQCTNCQRTFPDGSKEMLAGCPDCGGNKFQFTPPSRTNSSGANQSKTSGPNQTKTSGTERGRRRPASRTAGDDRSSPDRRSIVAEDRSEESAESSRWPDTAKRPADRADARTGITRDRDGPYKPGDLEAGNSVEERSSEAIEEDTAQANARSEIVSEDELPAHTRDRGTNPGFEHETATERRGDQGRPEDDPETPPEHGRVVSEPTDERPSLEELREELNEQFESIKIVRPGEYELNLMELYDRDEYIISLQEDGRYVIDVPDSWRNVDE